MKHLAITHADTALRADLAAAQESSLLRAERVRDGVPDKSSSAAPENSPRARLFRARALGDQSAAPPVEQQPSTPAPPKQQQPPPLRTGRLDRATFGVRRGQTLEDAVLALLRSTRGSTQERP